MGIRSHPLPDVAALPYWIWDDDQTLKAHPAYRQAAVAMPTRAANRPRRPLAASGFRGWAVTVGAGRSRCGDGRETIVT